MKETVAIASIAILFGITDANANNSSIDQNILQAAQKASTAQTTKRVHPVTGKRLRPTASKKRWHPAVYKKGLYRGERSTRRGNY